MPYDYDTLTDAELDPTEMNSPLGSIIDDESDQGVYAGSSPLSEIMLERARQLSPRRQDVQSRRDALLGAYKNLISAQKHRPLPVNDPGLWAAGAAGLMESQDPNMKAFGAGQIARMKAMTDQNNQETESLKNQALTQLQMDSAGLGFLDKDQATEMDLLKQAGTNDYRQQMLQMKMILAAMKNAPGAMGTGSSTPEAAAAAGLPLYTGSNPYAGLDTVGKRQMRMMFEKQVQKLQEEAEPMTGAIDRMKRFEQLNELTKDKVLGPGPVTDYLPNWSDEMKEMESIAAEITPQMRVPGSGATSDFDARMFQKATIGTGKRYEANKNIAQAYIASRQNNVEKSQFMEAYLNKYEHLRGAQQAWKKYLNANPIFDPKSKDFELNQKRQNWQEFFGGEKKPEGDEDGLSDEQKTAITAGAEMENADLNIPPAPKGYAPEKWKRVYNKMTPEQKALFGGKKNAP